MLVLHWLEEFTTWKVETLTARSSRSKQTQYAANLREFFLHDAQNNEELSIAKARRFVLWMQYKKGYRASTARKLLQFARQFNDWLNAYEFTEKAIFKHSKIWKEEKAKPKILTPREVQAFKSFEPKKEDYVRQAYILGKFQLLTGFAYVDTQQFDELKHTFTGPDGLPWIRKNRSKSKIAQILPYHEEAQVLAVPKMTNAMYNKGLKRIAREVGIKPISSHDLRKAAGKMWLDSGLSYIAVARMLGHSKIETTQRLYAISDEHTLHKELQRLNRAKMKAA